MENWKKFTLKKFPNVPGLTNKQIDALADLIMDSIRVSGRLGNQPCHDDTGVYKNGVYLKNGFDGIQMLDGKESMMKKEKLLLNKL